MTRTFKYILYTLITVCLLAACKDDKEAKYAPSDSVRISAFSLAADSALLDNLQNVFFTIDLEKGHIYNADSLPVGTDISSLVVKISTDSAQAINIETVDTAYNYIEYSKKAINFTEPVYAEVVSRSGNYKKTYEIKVNVHKTDPDRLSWGGMQYSKLPGEGNLTGQKTLRYNGLIYSFMQRNGVYQLATAAHPADQWVINDLSLSFTANLQSLHTTGDKLYILDNEGNLYTSTDGITWDATGHNYAAIIGCIGDNVHTLTQEGGNYYHDIYPRPEGYTLKLIDKEFPISGYSDMLTYNSPWLTSPQGMIIGGRKTDGTLTGAMWGFDGNTWAMLNNSIPPREGAIFFPYITFFVDDNWITSEMPTWFVIGGIKDNTALRDVWVTNNYGVSWKEAGINMALPGYIVSRGYASVVICDENIDSTLPAWQSYEMCNIPQGYYRMAMHSASSVSQVPYIYMFGGVSYDSSTFDQIWRAAINRLKFEPIL